MQVATRSYTVEQYVDGIGTGRIDLQPDFQRGDIWSINKKQRLIDTILRGWHVPPVHLVEIDANTFRFDVLDGQQRLTSIFDFVENRFPINGDFTPASEKIGRHHGRLFHELPEEIRSQVLSYKLTTVLLTEYTPEEPGELFARLNHPSPLSPAEQRNAFYGTVRDQIKHLSRELALEDGRDLFGFSNARMAYDDIVARLCLTVENQDLLANTSSVAIRNRYFEDAPFSSEVISTCSDAIELLRLHWSNAKVRHKLNKATMFTWLFFFVVFSRERKNRNLNPHVADLVDQFTLRTQALRESRSVTADSDILFPELFFQVKSPRQSLTDRHVNKLLVSYRDRAASRVADALSVATRDLALWLFAYSITDIAKKVSTSHGNKLDYFAEEFQTKSNYQSFDELARSATTSLDWGKLS